MRALIIGVAVLFVSTASQAALLPICHGGHRADRHLTCIVDGDTGWEHGVKWRYEAIDAPEMPAHAECRAEAAKALQARDRLRELMAADA